MTKAQEKRNKQFRETITRRLTVLFNPFRNYNYKSYVDSKIYPHKTLLESHWGSYSDVNEAFEALEGKTFGELGLDVHVDRYTRDGKFRRRTQQELREAKELALQEKIDRPTQLSSKLRQVQNSRDIMGLIEIHRLEWLGEVRDAFDTRFNKMIDSMCNSIEPKQGYFKIEVEELSNSWKEFEVLIHVEETTFHARAIWVNCVEKISHYRFITTTRKRK
jgi:hypothetical protein